MPGWSPHSQDGTTGAAAPPAAVRTLEFVVSGALIEVGTGHLPYDRLRHQLAEATKVILGDAP
jgi:hypothetical protein